MQQSGGSGFDAAASGAAAGGLMAILVILAIMFAVWLFFAATWWRLFTKAGQPGWGSLIPIYNMYLLCKIAGKPGWWVILLIIPCIGFIFGIIVVNAVAISFGKGTGFTVGLILIPIIFWPILAWGSAQYQGPATLATPTM